MNTIIWLCYLIASATFVFGLHLMRHPKTASNGNKLSATGMALAVFISLMPNHSDNNVWANSNKTGLIVAILALIVGAFVGIFSAKKVKMTDMPQLVSVFNAVGGGAAMFVALIDFIFVANLSLETVAFRIPVVLDIIIGSITLTGSIIAAGKLQGLIPGKPIVIKNSQLFLGVSILASFVFGLVVMFFNIEISKGLLIVCCLLACAFGVLMTLPIGGADMPVVISLLNAFTGIAVGLAGFVINNDALIIAGALVGASGSILTIQMANAMNRKILDIMMGGFGGEVATDSKDFEQRPVQEVKADDVAVKLSYANNIIIVPGYGLAVAGAQHDLAETVKILSEHGKNVKFAIHPVAGRMPGHMNVLLAEANIDYDKMIQMDEANMEFANTDLVLVVGANDVVNPAARDENSPIAGMPILNVDEAKEVIILKRSLSTGYAGIDNDLFYMPNSYMFFADAKQGIQDLNASVGEYL